MANRTSYHMEIAFNDLAVSAYQKRCAKLRAAHTAGTLSLHDWNDARIAVDMAFGKRCLQLNDRIEATYRSN